MKLANGIPNSKNNFTSQNKRDVIKLGINTKIRNSLQLTLNITVIHHKENVRILIEWRIKRKKNHKIRDIHLYITETSSRTIILFFELGN